MYQDARGLAISAANVEAAQAFDATISAYLRFARNTGQALKASFAADPEFPMAHCLKGYFFQLFSTPVLAQKAHGALEQARAGAKGRDMTLRENAHLDALESWLSGDLPAAVARWEGILSEHPCDMLALKLTTFMHFYLGDSSQLRDCVGRVRYAWDESVPDYGFVLGMHAFGFEECGMYAQAEAAGREALMREPEDAWAVHAVTHVMEMQDRRREGIEWVEAHQGNWSKGNNFRFHLWWHKTLFHLELEEYERVLELYDTEVRDPSTDEYLDICNATSLLWRLEERGVPVGDRWSELADHCEKKAQDHILVFPDSHYIMALAAAGRAAPQQSFMASLRVRTAASETTQDRVAAQVGLPLCEAVAAWYKDDFNTVTEKLAPIRTQIARIGGSHAQRDLYQQLLIAACMKSGRMAQARTLLSERQYLKPNNAWTWKRYAAALSAQGNVAAADAAAKTASRLLTA